MTLMGFNLLLILYGKCFGIHLEVTRLSTLIICYLFISHKYL